ncbi:MAG: metalloregulator ArsR/SmtB family transcription factor [Verrucomicrobiota bacterium]
MECVAICKCLCNQTRLRILNLLQEGPLCVCHLQEILGESQETMSKQLRYLKNHHLLTSSRENNWTVYALPPEPHLLLTDNLKCLQDRRSDYQIFQDDLDRRHTLVDRLADSDCECPPAFTRHQKRGNHAASSTAKTENTKTTMKTSPIFIPALTAGLPQGSEPLRFVGSDTMFHLSQAWVTEYKAARAGSSVGLKELESFKQLTHSLARTAEESP